MIVLHSFYVGRLEEDTYLSRARVNVQVGTYDVYVDGVFKTTVNVNAALTTLLFQFCSVE